MVDLLARLRPRWPHILGGVLVLLAGIAAILLYSGSYFDKDPFTRFPAKGKIQPILVLSLSGDMGLRYGMGGVIARALSADGIEVLGVNSPVLFRKRRTAAQVNAVIADLVRRAEGERGDRKLVLLGQSYGSDMLQTGLAHLPADLRAPISAVVLVVPGETAFFRSDPSGLAYMGKPDSIAITTARQIDWVPITCIYGVREPDSLCPLLKQPNVRVVALPGGHYLDHDDAALVAHVETAVRHAPSPPNSEGGVESGQAVTASIGASAPLRVRQTAAQPSA